MVHSTETSVGVLVDFYMLQVCGHIKHVVVLVALRIRVIISPVCEFLKILGNYSHCENGSFEVLSFQDV